MSVTFETVHQKLRELEEQQKNEIEAYKKQIEELKAINDKLREENEELKKNQHYPKPDPFHENINQAAAVGDMDSVLYILQDAPDLVNAQDFEHLDTPLHEAIWKSYFDIVELLIKRGADVNIKNRVPFSYFIRNSI